jgi:flagellar biosynthesis/type III secretory pathway protein FliH
MRVKTKKLDIEQRLGDAYVNGHTAGFDKGFAEGFKQGAYSSFAAIQSFMASIEVILKEVHRDVHGLPPHA